MELWLIILILAPFIIGMAGQVAQNLVLGTDRKTKSDKDYTGWRKVYYITVPWHALLVGGLIGLLGFGLGIPVPPVFGTEVGGTVLAYATSGGISIIGYDLIVKTIRRVISSIKLKED